MFRRSLVSALVFALGFTLLAGSAQAQTVRLSADAVHHLDAATLVGPVLPTQSITVGVFLANPNAAAIDAYLQELYDPSSPNYQAFLDPDTFNQQFGVPAATFTAAQSWLASKGLTVTPVPGAMNYLLAQGSAAQIEAAFGTALNWYSAGGRTFYANAQAPAVPANLGISKVLGLNNLNRFSTPHVGQSGPRTITTAAPTGSLPQTGLLSPQALWSIYDLPDTNRGNGESMAIIGWGVTTPVVGDLRAWENEFQLPQVPITVEQFGATDTPDTDDGSTIEWELDTQASTGMAPDVQSEVLYFAHHNTDADILAAIVGWVNDKKGPRQASASFGECENIPAAEPVIGVDGIEDPANEVLEQAVIEGRTLFSSTGDTGGSCPVIPVNTNGVATQAYPALNFPSASPWAVAVGGTVLNSDGANPPKRFSETAWEYTGGGNSTVIPAGPYQTGVAPTSCVTDDQGNPFLGGAPACRATPDVAAISGDVATGNGLMITDDDGADQQGAGTSLSSPLWLGMWTRIQAAARNKGLGFANFSLYRAAKGASASDFFDVTLGDNQPYLALPGYDNVSGWGTPDVTGLMLEFTGRTTPTHDVAPPVPAQVAPQTTCGSLFTDPAGDDAYVVQGQTLGAPGAQPQLDILAGQLLLSPDGQTLRAIITVRDLNTTIPTGGLENDYNLTWTLNGVQYFTQLAVLPGGVVQAYDGQVVHLSLETRYQQLHVDTGVLTPGPNGTVEVDVPLANIGSPATGQVLQRPSAASYVREGVLGGPLEPIDSAGPLSDYVLGGC